MNLRCLVDMDWLTRKDPTLSAVRTIIKYFPDGVNWNTVYKIIRNLDKNLQEEFTKLHVIDAKYRNNSVYRGIAIKEEIPYDSYTEYLCLKLKDYLVKHEIAETLSNTIGCDNPVLTAAVVIKTKAYRVSGEVYNEVKNNKLLNILCKR